METHYDEWKNLSRKETRIPIFNFSSLAVRQNSKTFIWLSKERAITVPGDSPERKNGLNFKQFVGVKLS